MYGNLLLQRLAQESESTPVSQHNLQSILPDKSVLNNTLASLQQQELIKLTSNGYCIQVPLVQYWFQNSFFN